MRPDSHSTKTKKIVEKIKIKLQLNRITHSIKIITLDYHSIKHNLKRWKVFIGTTGRLSYLMKSQGPYVGSAFLRMGFERRCYTLLNVFFQTTMFDW
jgi:hypothetical protein